MKPRRMSIVDHEGRRVILKSVTRKFVLDDVLNQVVTCCIKRSSMVIKTREKRYKHMGIVRAANEPFPDLWIGKKFYITTHKRAILGDNVDLRTIKVVPLYKQILWKIEHEVNQDNVGVTQKIR